MKLAIAVALVSGLLLLAGAIYAIATTGRRERAQQEEDCPCSDWDYRK